MRTPPRDTRQKIFGCDEVNRGHAAAGCYFRCTVRKPAV